MSVEKTKKTNFILNRGGNNDELNRGTLASFLKATFSILDKGSHNLDILLQ